MKKFFTKKRVLAIALSVLMVVSVSFAINFILREKRLNDLQNQYLLELELKKGSYSEDVIVLQNTTRARATELAEKTGASLRITSDGKFATLKYSGGKTVRTIIEDRENRVYLDEFSLDYYSKLNEEVVADERLPVKPDYSVNDAEYNKQGYLDYLNLANAWSQYKGDGITVAIIDTGIDTDHPEFAGKISEYSYNASTDKVVKDWGLEQIEDEQGHGTSVAGVIASTMDNVGIAGIAPNVELLIIKANCNASGGFASTSDLVFGLYYAIERDADVVNMSFGGDENPYSGATKLAVDSDISLFAATGNDSTSQLKYPAADPNVIGVGALEENGWGLAEYSNYGDSVDLVAPGTTYTTAIGGGYKTSTGTSLACPVAVAVTALFLQQNGVTEYPELKQYLFASCYDLGETGRDDYFGYGAIDASALLLEERGKITFNYLTDEIPDEKRVFIRNHTLQYFPEDPERDYSVFDGWYHDIHCTEPVTIGEDVLTNDVTIYASWVNEDDGVPYNYKVLDDGTIEILSYKGHRRFITIPEKIDGRQVSSIGSGAFRGSKNLRQVNLPEGLVKIGTEAFAYNANFTKAEIPASVEEIGSGAYSGNPRMRTVTFAKNSKLKNIGRDAFSNLPITKITIPASVIFIAPNAFANNVLMLDYIVEEGNANYCAEDGVLFNKEKTCIEAYPVGRTVDYRIPDSVTTIASSAFNYYTTESFSNTGVCTIDLNNVTTFNSEAFRNSSLTSIDLSNMTNIGSKSFSACYNLSKVVLGDKLTSLGMSSFSQCYDLTEIVIPSGIKELEEKVFASTGLTSITFESPSVLAKIGPSALSGTRLTSITIPSTVKEIANGAFADAIFLSEVNFEIGNQLETIGITAFAKTFSLKTITLPETVRSLGDYAFQNSALQNIRIPAGLTSLGKNPFVDCADLSTVTVAPENTHYQTIDGVLYTKTGVTFTIGGVDYTPTTYALVCYPGGLTATTYTVDANTEMIAHSAFMGITKLSDIILPEGLVEIHERAFERCIGLTKLDVPDSVKQIGRYAFANTANLSSVNFNETSTLPRISIYSFAYSGITSIRIPASVSTLAQYAFYNCEKLERVVFAKNSQIDIISAYQFAGGNNIKSIVFESGSALTKIAAHGLEGMLNLTELDFGDAKLTTIDNFALRYNVSLAELTIPDTVTEIGRFAFYDMNSLTELVLPAGLEYIGRFAFYGTGDMDLYFKGETLPKKLQEHWDEDLRGYYVGTTSVTIDDDYKYATLTSGDIAIIEYLGTDTSVDLTALNFGKIVNIGGKAFYRSTVESIVLPDTVHTIQASAFERSALKSVSIPANVNFIGKNAFASSQLESVEFADNCNLETIEKYAFAYTNELEGVIIPKSVTTLGSYVFSQSGIQTLVFEEGTTITEIPQNAFTGTRLTTVTIPDSVTLINHNAFRDVTTLQKVTFGAGRVDVMNNVFYNTGLTEMYIPATVNYIGEYAMVGLENLTEFVVSEDNEYYCAIDGLLYNKAGSKIIAVPGAKTGKFVMPETLEVIGFGAFENSSLNEIVFAENGNLLTFGYRAFYNADGLTSITIPASVISLDYYAFANCSNLTTVTFAEGSKLAGVYEGAFFDCRALTNIVLPDSVVEISDFAFYGCSNLKALPFSENNQVLGIYDYAFAYSGIEEVVLSERILDIGAYAFRGSKLKKAEIPTTNKIELMMGLGVFMDCKQLEELTVPFLGRWQDDTQNEYIGFHFGAGSYEANKTYVPKSLKKLNITGGLETIQPYAFYETQAEAEIFGIENVTKIGIDAFKWSNVIYSMPENAKLYDELGQEKTVLGDELGTGLKGKYRIQDSVTTIIGALIDKKYLEEVIIPATVVDFGWDYTPIPPLRDNVNLKRVVLEEGITEIPYNMFGGCISLTEVVLPSTLTTIGGSIFSGCSSLTEFVIPETVTSLGNGIFSGATSLEKVTLPSNLTTIGRAMFNQCSSLKSITIPSSVVSIEAYAFSGCTNLFNVTLPSGITYVGEGAFEGAGLTEIVIPDKVETIDTMAFKDCTRLGKITLGAGVTAINGNGGYYEAFYNCVNLKEIINNSSLTLNIGFEDNGRVALYARTITDAEGNKTYVSGVDTFEFIDAEGKFRFTCENGEYQLVAYYGEEKEVTLPESINGSSYDISYLTGIEKVIIPEGFTEISANAFNGCRILKEVVLPETGITKIGDKAFYACRNLEKINLNEGLTEIGEWAFYYTDITQINLPESLEKIGESAFSVCQKLESVKIPSKITTIERETFYICDNLKSVEMGDNVTSIGYGAFESALKLKTIRISRNVQTIGPYAFRECNNLLKLSFGAKLATIDVGALSQCPAIIEIDPDNPNFVAENGAIYDKAKTQIVMISDLLTEYEVPNTVRWMNGAFTNKVNLKKITFEEGSIASYFPSRLFEGCSSLEYLQVPDSIEHFQDFVFEGCDSLKSLELGAGVKDCGSYTFRYSKALETIIFNEGLETIGAYAFYGCTNLKSVTLPSTLKVIGGDAFGCTGLTKIALPNGLQEIQGSAFEGTALSEIDIPDSVTVLGFGAFQGAKQLRKATIGSGITTIGERVFYNCESLESVILNEGLKTICEDAFYGCGTFYSITLPSTLTEIQPQAFYFVDVYEIINNSGLQIEFNDNENNGRISYYTKTILEQDGTRRYASGSENFEYIEKDDFRYMYDGTKYTMIEYIGTAETVTLPLDINGNTYSMYEVNGIKNLIVPEGIAIIDDAAFRKVTELKTVQFPSGLKVISTYAFEGCTGLTSIALPDGCALSYSVFKDCTALEEITVGKGCSMYSDSINNTAYYNNPENWENDGLYLDYILVQLKDGAKCAGREGTTEFATNVINRNNATTITTAYVHGRQDLLLEQLTNLETLIITQYPDVPLYWYFSYDTTYPQTLKNVVLGEDFSMRESGFFYGIANVNIYVDKPQIAVMWDEDMPGWNNGNTVYYQGKWIIAEFFDVNGLLLEKGFYKTTQIIHPYWLEDFIDGNDYYVFKGYDVDGDGVSDTVPATSASNVKGYAVFIKTTVCAIFGHEYGEWELAIQPGCETSGEERLTCSRCNIYTAREVAPAGHDYENEFSLDVEPSCTSTGLKSKHCKNCLSKIEITTVEKLKHVPGATERSNEVAGNCSKKEEYDLTTYCDTCGENIGTEHVIGDYVHAWKSWKDIDVYPDCTTEGFESTHCELCEATKDRQSIGYNSNAHDYTSSLVVENVVPATCTQDGSYDSVCYCSRCGVEVYRDARIEYSLGHDYSGDWEDVTQASCTQNGYRIQRCVRCEEIIDEYYPSPLDHVPNDYWEEGGPASCTEAGWEQVTCSVCGAMCNWRDVTPLGHSPLPYVEENRVEPEGGIDGGYDMVSRCERCNEILDSYHEIIRDCNHVYNDYFTTDEYPSCETPGSESRHCSLCGHQIDQREIPALGHTEDVPVQENYQAPSCEEVGGYEEVAYCKYCGFEMYRIHRTVDAEHSYGEWEVITHPSCTQTGERARECSVCHNVEREKISAQEHNPSDWQIITEATKESAGLKRRTCTACGNVVEEEIIPVIESSGCGGSVGSDNYAISIVITLLLLTLGAVKKFVNKKKKINE